MTKNIHSITDTRQKVLDAVDKVADPIVHTMTPKGSNVIFETPIGFQSTNDGMTIMSQMEMEDPIDNAVADIMKQAAMRTNNIAGDGTTTSILLTKHFIKEGMNLITLGWNEMKLKRTLNDASEVVLQHIHELKKNVDSESKLMDIATISSNNDTEIANNVIDAVRTTGIDGLVVIDRNSKEETTLKKEEGFIIESGMIDPLLINNKEKGIATYKNVPVILTDRRIYDAEEALCFLKPLASQGIHDVVIIAKDFIGKATNTFISNHMKQNMNILLIKDVDCSDKDITSLEDLSAYLGGCPIISLKYGKKPEDITMDDYGMIDRIVATGVRTVIYKENNKVKKERVKALKELMTSADENDTRKLEKRLANMTTGSVTILVGGRTSAELADKIYRYEDAVNATRSAMKDGYVVGGGVTLYKAMKRSLMEIETSYGADIARLMTNVCSAPLYQIAHNCDIHYKLLIEKVEAGKGYNAATDTFENLEKAGVIEPTTVLTMAFSNSLSAAGTILGSKYLITTNKEKENVQ